jgi:hypothetical protein
MTHAVRENEQPLVLGTTWVWNPEGDVVAVVVALPREIGQTLFTVHVRDETSGAGRGST